MNLKKAYTYLGNVTEHKQCIPFRRYDGATGRTAQAKEFKTDKGESKDPLGSRPSSDLLSVEQGAARA